MSEAQLTQAVSTIAVFLAIRWPIAVYVGVLSGLQRMEVLNGIKVGTLAVRLGGGLAVLLVWRTLEAFLWWTTLSAVVELVIYHVACQRLYAAFPRRPGLSMAAIKRVWRFSLSMNVLAVFAVLTVQFDRLLISVLLPLDELGRYNLAYTAASLATLVITAVSTAMMPSFAAAHTASDRTTLSQQYFEADRIMMFLVGLVTLSLVIYGDFLLKLWVGDAASGAAAPLALLAVGFWFSSILANAYSMSIAAGKPQRFLKVNLIAVLPYLCLLYVMIERWHLVGAASSWIILNVFYCILLVRHVQRDIAGVSTPQWLLRTMLPLLLIGIFSFSLPRVLAESIFRSELLIQGSALIASALLYTGLFLILFGPSKIKNVFRHQGRHTTA